MASNNDTECYMKVPIEINKTLNKILKKTTSAITFQKLSTLFEKKHKSKLAISITDKNEIVLIANNKNCRNTKKTNYSEADIAELTNYFKKVNFTNELNQTVKNIPSSSISSDSYITIKLESPYTPDHLTDEINCESDLNLENPELPSIFDKLQFKQNEIYNVSVQNIYNPSLFWIRIGTIDVFQKKLWEFCSKNHKNLAVKKSDIYVGLNCVALISDLYFRGRLVRTNLSDGDIFTIFLYDFGMIATVHISQLYHLHHPYGNIPAFAIRARLANIATVDDKMWKLNAINKFTELVENKPLRAHITRVNEEEKFLEITLFHINGSCGDMVPSINFLLVSEGLARQQWHPPVCELTENNHYKLLRKHLYLFPSFEMIENVIVLPQVQYVEHLRIALGNSMPWDVLFPQLFKYELQTGGEKL